jgi:hypothetical protein
MPYKAGYAKKKKEAVVDIFQHIKRLRLNLTDFQSQRNCHRILSSAQSESNWRIWWTKLNPGYKDTLSRASIFRCYAVLLKAFYGHVLPPWDAKGS